MATRMTNNEVKKVKALKAKGLSCSKIAERIGRSPSTVHRALELSRKDRKAFARSL